MYVHIYINNFTTSPVAVCIVNSTYGKRSSAHAQHAQSMRVHDMPQMNSTDRFPTSIADEKDRSRCFNNRNELRIDRSWHAYAYHVACMNAIYSKHACYKYSAS